MNNENINNKIIQSELKYKPARCIESIITNKYIYRDVIVKAINNIIYLHFNSNKNYTREIYNKYYISIENNIFTHRQLVVIFNNLEYIIEVLKKRILNIFDIEEYENIENGFIFEYNKSSKSFIITLSYVLIEQLTVNYKNEMITEIIINVLLESANELDNNNSSSSITINNGDIKYMGQII